MDRVFANPPDPLDRPEEENAPQLKRQGQGDMRALLAKAGLRITRPRLILAGLLFNRPHRHLTAEMLHHEMLEQGRHFSLATIYNTLHHFTDAGLLREVSVAGRSSWFDTNVSRHHHFYFEDSGRLEDCPGSAVGFSRLPDLPPKTKLAGIDVVLRVRED